MYNTPFKRVFLHRFFRKNYERILRVLNQIISHFNCFTHKLVVPSDEGAYINKY